MGPSRHTCKLQEDSQLKASVDTQTLLSTNHTHNSQHPDNGMLELAGPGRGSCLSLGHHGVTGPGGHPPPSFQSRAHPSMSLFGLRAAHLEAHQ